jgi:PIN domain nuclease of toxin-antitoxin system
VIVLDTHAWLWWADDPTRLSPAATSAIEQAESIGVSSISSWELSLLIERGRLKVNVPVIKWLAAMASMDDRLQDVALDRAIAVRAAQLENRGFHADPADRFILATAEFYNAQLVTRDAAIREFAPQRTIW